MSSYLVPAQRFIMEIIMRTLLPVRAAVVPWAGRRREQARQRLPAPLPSPEAKANGSVGKVPRQSGPDDEIIDRYSRRSHQMLAIASHWRDCVFTVHFECKIVGVTGENSWLEAVQQSLYHLTACPPYLPRSATSSRLADAIITITADGEDINYPVLWRQSAVFVVIWPPDLVALPRSQCRQFFLNKNTSLFVY
jgi:hypothetical protein